MLEKTTRLKREWAGHVAQMHSERRAKIVTYWALEEGLCCRDRPWRRWCDVLVMFAGKTWPEIAQDQEI